MATYRYTNTGPASLKLGDRPVYGSSRLGTYGQEVELHSLQNWDPADPVLMDEVALQYELTDHLGNVCAVVTGRLMDGNGGGTAKQAELVSGQGYEAGGSLLPGRNYSSSSYNYGFNGMRKDDEIHGATGTSYDFGARLYDPRIMRWLSLDPLAAKYPQWSPYQFVDANPIRTIDVDGRDIIILNDRQGAHGAGHQAILIGSHETGWTYVSKDGDSNGVGFGRAKFTIATFKTIEEFSNSVFNFELAPGQYHSDENGTHVQEPVYRLDENGNKIQRYDRASLIRTTQESGYSTDRESLVAAMATAVMPYSLGSSDCSDVVTAALLEGSDSNGKQLETVDAVGQFTNVLMELPNFKQSAEEFMNTTELRDRAMTPRSLSLQKGEQGRKDDSSETITGQ